MPAQNSCYAVLEPLDHGGHQASSDSAQLSASTCSNASAEGATIDATLLELHLRKLLEECQNGIEHASTHLPHHVPVDHLRAQLASFADRHSAVRHDHEGDTVLEFHGIHLSVVRTPQLLVLVAARAEVNANDVTRSRCILPEAIVLDPSIPLRKRAETAVELAGTEMSALGRAAMRQLLSDRSLLLQVIACDALNQHSEPAIPQFLIERRGGGTPTEPVSQTRSTTEPLFEDRINVNEYAYHEAVHPAYGTQVLALARMHDRFADLPRGILDIGSGPGLPTLMMLELYPDTSVDAIEPSPAAYQHLCSATRDLPVNAFCKSILDFTGSGQYDVVSSVGASHHMDTRRFLQACRKHASKNGLVLIADEFVSKFRSRSERRKCLTDHHRSYILKVLENVDPNTLPAAERERFMRFSEAAERSELSESDLKKLLKQVSLGLDHQPGGDSPWPRVRLAVLELQALVAGIDYEVERKTYAANFLQLAQDAGLKLLQHERIFRSHGPNEWDAGTHCFCFTAS